MQIDIARYRQTFFEEAAEHLATLEATLLRLEASPGDQESLNEAFRAVHSIKGGTEAVGLPAVARFSHALESLLEQFRSRSGPVPTRLIDLLLQGADMLNGLIAAARAGDGSPPGSDELLGQLTRALNVSEQPATMASVEYRLVVTPHRDAFRSGLDPLLPLRDLEKLGSVSEFQLNMAGLPLLADLDPEGCYLTWSAILATDQPTAVIRDVFAFTADLLEVTIEPLAEQSVQEKPKPGKSKVEKPKPGKSKVEKPKPEKSKVEKPKPTASKSKPGSSANSIAMPVRSGSICGTSEQLHFGSYLVQRGLCSADQVLEALERQQASRPFLWKLAVEDERLTMRQVFETLEATGIGQHFGETAIRLGYLTPADLGGYFLQQARIVPSLDTVLLANGVLTSEVLTAARTRFAAETGAVSELDDTCCAPPVAAIAAPFLPPPRGSLLVDNAGMLGDFCGEADEHLEASDRYLLVLDGDPTNREAVNAVYRAYHSIKGVSSMLGLEAVRMLAHEAENMLNLARDGRITLRGGAMDLAFASTDALKRQIGYIRDWLANRGQMEQDPALPKLITDLRRATGAGSDEDAAPPPAAPPPVIAPAPAKVKAAEPVPAKPKPALKEAPAAVPVPPVADAPVAAAASAPPAEQARDAAPRAAAIDRDTVRVDRARLDKLINAVGELVIAQSMVRQEVEGHLRLAGGRSQALPQLDKISGELQELGLSLRMVPLQGTFQKMTRLVRDLSRKINKPVALELQGEETELDKSVVDQLGDPLMHMVRNAIDHGLESPEERVAVGKPTEGHVILKAYHQGGNVYIALTDDGRGLHRDAILRKALERGLITEGQRLADPEVYALIFEPGFSTAKTVTDVSGRGVGMDVVRRNVQALQGSIHIRTEQGKGTTFTIRLPLTLAIMDGLMVGLHEDIYVLPLLSVIESFRPRPVDIHSVANKGEVVIVRGEAVPLLKLACLLNRPGMVADPCKGLVVLVEDQGKKFALLVDELLGQMPVVVKSLDVNFRKVDGVTGATILSDGRVAMILDIPGLTRTAYQPIFRCAPAAEMATELDNLGVNQ